MPELLEVFSLKGKSLGFQSRSKFYSEIKKEFAKKGKISKKVKAVRLILMNSKGGIYLQKRSNAKKENPGLYDKTIGGHVYKGHTWELTVVKECAEELGFPAAVLGGKEFNEAVKNVDLRVIGVFKKISQNSNFNSVRITKKGGKFIEPFITNFYLGYYDGSLRFADGESSGVEVYKLKELKKEIEKTPEKFTEDLKYMVKKFGKYLKPIK